MLFKVLFFISLGLIVLFSILFFIYYKLQKNKTITYLSTIQKLKESLSYNFDADSNFLIYLISYKCKIYQDMIMDPATELSKVKLLNTEDLDKAVDSITVDILSAMSDNYKNIMYKYFTKESLKTYIIEIVMNQMFKFINGKNKDKIKSFKINSLVPKEQNSSNEDKKEVNKPNNQYRNDIE